MFVVVHKKLLPGWVEVPLNLLSEEESVDLLLSTGKVEVISDGALAAAKKIAKAANYLRTYHTESPHSCLKRISLFSVVFVHPWWGHRPGKEQNVTVSKYVSIWTFLHFFIQLIPSLLLGCLVRG